MVDDHRERELRQVVSAILDSYERVGAINQVNGTDIPSQQHIVQIMQVLRTVLFPGFYEDRAVENLALPYVTGQRMVWLYQHLSSEINRCLCFECREKDQCERLSECRERSERIALKLLRAIPSLRAQLQLDVEATLAGDPAAQSANEVILAYPGIAAITVHRVAHLLYREEVPLLPRIVSEHVHSQTGIDIHPGATIGSSFAIDHGTGVVIGETTRIGDRVKIYQGVTLGALSVSRDLRGQKRHPTIEDDVIIYSGATILGGRTVIGRGSVIGGNVWLVKSVPPYSKVYNPESSQEPIVARQGTADGDSCFQGRHNEALSVVDRG